MKAIFFSIIIMSLLWACNNEAGKEEELADVGDTTLADVIIVEDLSPEFYLWEVNAENKTKRRRQPPNDRFQNADSVIAGLNNLFPYIRLEKVKQHGDTLIARIPDSGYLGEQMGSYGAENYLANVVINLTSITGINYVRLVFKPGSHASPGTWSAKEFADIIEK